MVKIRTIYLKNFRGAADVSIELVGKTDNRIVTLIGLNESGKTTILEGLSHFPTTDKAAASIFRTPDTASIAGTFVPIHKTGVFTGEVKIIGAFETEPDDLDAINRLAAEDGVELDPSRPISFFEVSKVFEFKDGDYIPSPFFSKWANIDLYARTKKRASFQLRAVPPLGVPNRNADLWVRITNELMKRLPNVVYFPNTIVDIPRKIYINKYSGETINNSYFRRAMEYILADSGTGMSMATHVTARIAKYRKADDKGWINSLLASDDKDKIDSVFSRLSALLSEEILGAWSKVFNRPVSATRVEIRWFVDPENDEPFIELKVSDGRSSYHLHQRSLGFRWFFSFLLFTKFGRDRERSNVFLFDEPAANLHAKAQAELLESFETLSDAGDIVIYSTHSHHMINPRWLSGAYIVENEAIDYDSADAGSIENLKDTKISVSRYRTFVGNNGSRVSYYQPVLERLHYVEPELAHTSTKMLVEGPSDFYALSYALRRSKHLGRLTVYPGTGSGSLDTLIELALGRGNPFLVVLDDDTAGRKSAARYRDLFHLSDTEVITLAAVDPSLVGKQLEDLLSAETKGKVEAAHGNAKKKTIGLYLAEICAANRDGAMSDETLKSLVAVLDYAAAQLALTVTSP